MFNVNEKRLGVGVTQYDYIKPVEILKRVQITFLIDLRLWIEDLKVRCYKDYVSRNRIKNKKYNFVEL